MSVPAAMRPHQRSFPDPEGGFLPFGQDAYLRGSESGRVETTEFHPPRPETPDPDQGHAREWPSTPYSDHARAPEPPWEEAFCIALLGDCTVACRYFPPANRPEAHLVIRLRRAFPSWKFLVRNLAADGDTAAGFARGRMEQALREVPRLDAAIIRYGINDRKQHGILCCVSHLRELCQALEERYPNLRLVVETGLWVDYPDHYLWDRNARL